MRNKIKINLNTIINNVSLDGITDKQGNCYNPNSVGGAIFYNKQKFFECGMENEYFMSWGWEDVLRTYIIQTLGFRLGRIPGILYHLNHPTSPNSSNVQHKAYQDNYNEYVKTSRMNLEQLRQYIKTWNWVPR